MRVTKSWENMWSHGLSRLHTSPYRTHCKNLDRINSYSRGLGLQQCPEHPQTMSAKHIIPPLSPIAVGICAVILRFGTCQVASGKSAKIRILPCSPAYFGTCLRVHQPQPGLANRWLERLAQWVLRLRLAQWALQLHLSPTSLTGWRRPREAKIHQSHLVSAGKIDYGE